MTDLEDTRPTITTRPAVLDALEKLCTNGIRWRPKEPLFVGRTLRVELRKTSSRDGNVVRLLVGGHVRATPAVVGGLHFELSSGSVAVAGRTDRLGEADFNFDDMIPSELLLRFDRKASEAVPYYLIRREELAWRARERLTELVGDVGAPGTPYGHSATLHDAEQEFPLDVSTEDSQILVGEIPSKVLQEITGNPDVACSLHVKSSERARVRVEREEWQSAVRRNRAPSTVRAQLVGIQG